MKDDRQNFQKRFTSFVTVKEAEVSTIGLDLTAPVKRTWMMPIGYDCFGPQCFCGKRIKWFVENSEVIRGRDTLHQSAEDTILSDTTAERKRKFNVALEANVAEIEKYLRDGKDYAGLREEKIGELEDAESDLNVLLAARQLPALQLDTEKLLEYATDMIKRVIPLAWFFWRENICDPWLHE